MYSIECKNTKKSIIHKNKGETHLGFALMMSQILPASTKLGNKFEELNDR